MTRFSTLAVIAVAGISARLGAQQVRGVVRDSALAMPLGGAVVTLLDSAGASISRVISDASGSFVLSTRAGAVRLRAVRIGYRPRDVRLPAGTNTVEIAMTKLPPMLAAVRVTDSELCPGANASASAVELWEQAKAGLLATVVARETKPAKMQALTYKRITTTTDERVTEQSTQLTSGYSNRPFVAVAEASFFARRGFMQEDASGRLYSAPDADVLLDEDFAATHCFHIQAADNDHPGQIGLAFGPARGRDALVDVTGVIWIDRISPQLRTLDFLYTGLEPAATRARSGGHLEFRTMENGLAFIERWRLRLVTLLVDERSRDVASGLPGERRGRADFRVADLRESGGIVLTASWPDGTEWRDSLAGLSGSVLQLHLPIAVPAAVVSLAGTTSETQTSSNGSFDLSPVVPGRYTVVITDTTLAQYAAPRSTKLAVDIVRGALTRIRVELPPLVDVIRDVCRDQPMPRGTSMIVGRVILPGATRPSGRVLARWQATYNNGSPVTSENGVGRAVAVNGAEQRVNLDNEGHFVVCGVARGRPIHLRYTENERFADTTLVVGDTLLHPVEWRLVLPPPRPNPLETPDVESGAPVREPFDVSRTPRRGQESEFTEIERRVRRPLSDLGQDLRFALRTHALRAGVRDCGRSLRLPLGSSPTRRSKRLASAWRSDSSFRSWPLVF